jgi:recombination protein RecA
VKNKVAPPFKIAEFDIMYNEGISKEGDLINTGVKTGVVERSGNSYVYNGTKLGVGIDNAKQFLKDNPKIFNEIDKVIRQKILEEKK